MKRATNIVLVVASEVAEASARWARSASSPLVAICICSRSLSIAALRNAISSFAFAWASGSPRRTGSIDVSHSS